MSLKLGVQFDCWGAQPHPNFVDLAVEAEKLGYDCVFTAESWGSAAFRALAWIGARTSGIRLGTAVVQLLRSRVGLAPNGSCETMTTWGPLCRLLVDSA